MRHLQTAARLLPLFLAVPACAAEQTPTATPAPATATVAVTASARPITLSIVSTNDVHGHVQLLPRIAGLVANLRRARAADGGGVLVLDGGDTIQGDLASNILEGAPVIDAFNAIGYDAAAVGNHEFDFGPVGPRAVPGPGDDPRGALDARAAQARYPLLSANLIEEATSKPYSPPNLRPSAIVNVAGVNVGLVGLLTLETTRFVLASLFAGLRLDPLVDVLTREAAALRAQGATVVVAVAHAGGSCTAFDEPDNLGTCDRKSEIFQVAEAVPAGTVDAIVAGHTHQRLSHRVNGIPIIEAGEHGEYLARVDLVIDPETKRVVSNQPHPPLEVCTRLRKDAPCARQTYEGAPVVEDPEVLTIVQAALGNAAKRMDTPLGVTLSGPVERGRGESALGNLVADLMRKARPKSDVTFMFPGGIRTNLPAGPLRYGSFYEMYPRDSTFATATLTGAQLAAALESNFTDAEGLFFAISGARVNSRCNGDRLVVTLERETGKPIRPTDKLVVTTNNLIATAAKGAFVGAPWHVEDDPPIREELIKVLTERGGVIAPDDRALIDPEKPRITVPSALPVRCPVRKEAKN